MKSLGKIPWTQLLKCLLKRRWRNGRSGNRERGTGTEVWERIVSGNLHKKSKMAYKDQEPGIIDKREATRARVRGVRTPTPLKPDDWLRLKFLLDRIVHHF